MDAAVCIPIFLISMCSILMLISQVITEDNNYYDAAKTCVNISNAAATAGLDVQHDYYNFDGSRVIVYWPFTGEPDQTGNERVFIFPKSGQRYHVYGCRTLKSGEREEILTDAIRNTYSPCKICKPSELPNGSCIYLFSDESEIYHRKECSSITKSYECVTKEEAESRGFTPCLLCIGSGDD